MTATATKQIRKTQRNYFLKDKLNRYYLDDGETFIEHKPLDEGLFQAYQDLTSKVKLDSKGDTEVDLQIGEQRRFLQDKLVKGWNLVDDEGDSIEYSVNKLRELPPDIINDLMADIYKANKILSGEDDSPEGKDKSKTN